MARNHGRDPKSREQFSKYICNAIRFPFSLEPSQERDSSTSTASRLQVLPNEVLSIVCQHLTVTARVNLALTSKSFATFASTSGLLTFDLNAFSLYEETMIMSDSMLSGWQFTSYSYERRWRYPSIQTVMELHCTTCSKKFNCEWILNPDRFTGSLCKLQYHLRTRHQSLEGTASMITVGMLQLRQIGLELRLQEYKIQTMKSLVLRFVLGLPGAKYRVHERVHPQFHGYKW